MYLESLFLHLVPSYFPPIGWKHSEYADQLLCPAPTTMLNVNFENYRAQESHGGPQQTLSVWTLARGSLSAGGIEVF